MSSVKLDMRVWFCFSIIAMTTCHTFAQQETTNSIFLPQEVYSADVVEGMMEEERILEALASGDVAALQEAVEELMADELIHEMDSGSFVVVSGSFGSSEYFSQIALALRKKLDGLEQPYDPEMITGETIRQQMSSQPIIQMLFDPSQHQGPQHWMSSASPVMSLSDALNSISTKEREALRGYEHFLEDEETFTKSRRSIPDEAKMAALHVYRLRYPDPAVKEAIEEGERLAALDEQRGYIFASLPSPKTILSRIRQHQLHRLQELNHPNELVGSDHWPDTFVELKEFEQRTGRIAPRMPAYAVPIGTESYIGPWEGGSARVVANSSFGAPLMITEVPVDDVTILRPNLTIFGRDAHVKLVKHADGEWSTFVGAFDGEMMYQVEVATKLEGVQREEFVRFATEILEYR